MIRNSLHIKNFQFETGAVLPDIEVVFHTSRPKWDGKGRVIWICHALTADSNVEDWWAALVGEGKYFDTNKDFIICVNALCSPYGSSGPISINPSTGERYGFDFPPTTVRDSARTYSFVRKSLGIDSVDMIIGSSLGGFHAIEAAIAEPEVYKQAYFIATAPEISPWLLAQTQTQLMALDADQTFRTKEGLADLSGGKTGLKCSRAQAMLSYRSHKCYCKTQKEEDPERVFADRAASYQRYQGEKFIHRFDAYSYWYTDMALTSHNAGRSHGGTENALSLIKAQTIVVSIDTDVIFPPYEAQEWSKAIRDCHTLTLESIYGHDGFLLEFEKLTEIFDKYKK